MYLTFVEFFLHFIKPTFHSEKKKVGFLFLTFLFILFIFSGVTFADTVSNVKITEKTDAIVMGNPIFEIKISKKTAEIVSLSIKGKKDFFSSPAGVIIKDKSENIEIGPGEGEVTGIRIKDNISGSAELLIEKKCRDDYFILLSIKVDSDSLFWDARVQTQFIKPREISIDFVFPLASNMEYVFWAGSQGKPARIQDVFPLRLIYRQNMIVPFFTLYDTKKDIGFSFVSPFDIKKPGLSFDFMQGDPGKKLAVSNFYLRLEKGKEARAAVYFVVHEGDWRPGLGWMLGKYPEYFYPVSKRVLDGEGWYTQGTYSDNESMMKTAAKLGATWNELHYTFPFYGMYVTDKEEWDATGAMADAGTLTWDDWESGKIQVFKNSYSHMRSLIDKWHKYGIQTYLYLENFEAWKPYSKRNFSDDIALDAGNAPYQAWYNCYLMNPDPAFDWGKHMVEQVKRIPKTYPAVDGIFLDRDDYWNYDYRHDDGVTMIGKKPCYMLGFAQEKMNEIIGNTLHPVGMGVWSNGPTSIEVCKGIDGLMAEAAGGYAKMVSYAGIAKPMICLPYDNNPSSTEEKLKVCFVWGYFPSIAYGNKRSLKIEEKYRSVFGLLKGRRWVLNAHALEVPQEMDGNIFRAPSGDYLVAVASPGKSQINFDIFDYDVPVKIRIPDASKLKYCYLLSGDYKGVQRLDHSCGANTVEIKIPAQMVSSMIVLSEHPRFDVVRKTLPILTAGNNNDVKFEIFNSGAKKKNFDVCMESPWGSETKTIIVEGGAPGIINFDIDIPDDLNGREVNVKLATPEGLQDFSFYVIDPLQYAPNDVYIRSSEGETLPFYIVNNTEKNMVVGLSAEYSKEEANVVVPPLLIIRPFNKALFNMSIMPVSENGTITVTSDLNGKKYSHNYNFRSVMVFSKNDLFNDNFASGKMEKWEVIEGNFEKDNGSIAGSGPNHLAIVKNSDWSDYEFQVTTKISGSSDPSVGWLKSYIFVRVRDDQNFYRFGIHGDVNIVDLYKCIHGKWTQLATSPFTPKKNKWYVFKVEVTGNHIKGYVDGKKMVDTRDSGLKEGGIGIGVLENAMNVNYKNVIVRKIE